MVLTQVTDVRLRMRMKRLLQIIAGALLPLPLLAIQLFPGQELGGYGGVDGSEFVFARLRYNEGLSNFRGWGGRPSWAVDWPKADKQFIFAIDRMSNVRVVLDKDVAIDIMDPNLFSYPFLYALEVGRGMTLSTPEAERLREYMLRGGFLVIDDFWGTYEWQNFYAQLHKIFPDREPEEIPLTHQIFHSFFDIPEILQDGDQLQHRHRRCLGMGRCGVLSQPVRGLCIPHGDQLDRLFDDPLNARGDYPMIDPPPCGSTRGQIPSPRLL